MNTDSIVIGLDERAAEAAQYPDLFAGRVVSQSKSLYRVALPGKEIFARVSGRFRQESNSTGFPVVGDFVMTDGTDGAAGDAIIHRVLERRSVFIRKAAGASHKAQAIAANIDIAFLCMGLNGDFNLRRLERYLSIAWDSGAVPVVVLTKSDLCGDMPDKLSLVESVAVGADVIVTSACDEEGLDALKPYITGKTAAFLGSSGIGKSTLINMLAGKEVMATGQTRGDGKGRHTTTSRELIALCGGAVIDTPGMRELGIENADVSSSFSDVYELAQGCRFSDCSHICEPGCAVLEAVKEGLLSQDRLSSYRKLIKEAGYEGLNSRQIESKKINEMFADFGGIKNARRFAKEKNKRP